MPYAVEFPKGVDSTKAWFEFSGLTSGNGQVIRYPDWADECVVEYIPTSAGTASLQYSLDNATPTDNTGFSTTNIGSFTSQSAQVVAKAAWLALVPASGTWTVRFLFKKV